MHKTILTLGNKFSVLYRELSPRWIETDASPWYLPYRHTPPRLSSTSSRSAAKCRLGSSTCQEAHHPATLAIGTSRHAITRQRAYFLRPRDANIGVFDDARNSQLVAGPHLIGSHERYDAHLQRSCLE